MSFKLIDLQLALNKNDEAGIKQNQLSQKPRQDEALLEHQVTQTTDRDRQRSGKLEESSKTGIQNRSKDREQRQKGRSARRASGTEEAEPSTSNSPGHPYKGHHIDLSL